MRKLIYIFIAGVLLIIFAINFDQIKYKLIKTFMNNKFFIEQYASIKLPDSTEVISFDIEPDGEINSDVLLCKIIVDEIDFKNMEEFSNTKNNETTKLPYSFETEFYLNWKVTKSNFDYEIWKPQRVSKNNFYIGLKTQQNKQFVILKEFNGKRTICIYVDKLGWWKFPQPIALR